MKRHLLGRGVAHSGPRVGAANRLRRPAFLDDEEERMIRVVDDLLVLEQLEEAIVRDVFLRVVTGAAAEKNGEPDEGKRDREKDDAAPVEVRVAAAVFVVFGRITIGLGHRNLLR